MINPAVPIRLTCPACGKYLATLDGASVELPPCRGCGAQVTVRLTGKRRGQASPEFLQPIEVKQARP